jgi:glycine cleavage system protein P-like pyridoxal-binding family
MGLLGKEGMREVAELCVQKSHHAARLAAAIPGYKLAYQGPSSASSRSNARSTRRSSRAPGSSAASCRAWTSGASVPEWKRRLLVAVTEQRSADEIERWADVLRAREGSDERAHAGAPRAPAADRAGRSRPPRPRASRLRRAGEAARRAAAGARLRVSLEFPQVSEPEVVRHFVELSGLNHHIDRGFYPLGSCTMKHNPKINDELAALPGIALAHPLAPTRRARGALRVIHDLSRALAAITGFAAVTTQPAAGAQGELTGLLMIRAWHRARGEGDKRRRVLVPDSAHGTNPASVHHVGYET